MVWISQGSTIVSLYVNVFSLNVFYELNWFIYVHKEDIYVAGYNKIKTIDIHRTDV